MQGLPAALQSALQLSSGGEQMDPAWWPHTSTPQRLQCAESVLCAQSQHLEVPVAWSCFMLSAVPTSQTLFLGLTGFGSGWLCAKFDIQTTWR